jgi:hypothetical protein
VAIALEADDPEPAAVPVLVTVDGRIAHRLAVRRRDGHAEAQRHREIEAQGVEPLAQQGRADELAFSALLTRVQGRRDAAREGLPGRMVSHAAALERRRLTR